MSREIKFIIKNGIGITLVAILFVFTFTGYVTASRQEDVSAESHSNNYFKIQVVDRQTGRGVPLVQLRTTNNIRYYTDSGGIVAFYEPGLMNMEVFFFVESPGYEFPKDGFGFRGTRLKTTPGASAVIKIDRINIAERLYRVTGEGIYRDSVLTGSQVPLENPVLNGQVMGQDSVDTCIHHGRLFWFWGDTGRPSYPLGHFAMAGAVSDLPRRGGLDPAIGVKLTYFVDKNGFSRPLCRLKEPGLVWLDGFLTVADHSGQERIVAKYARLKDLGKVLERGLVAYNDTTESFEPLLRADPNSHCLPSPNFGRAFAITVDGRKYYYFALPFPLTVRMRVEATWDSVTDPNRYEILTAASRPSFLVHRPSSFRWVRFGELAGADPAARARIIKTLKKERQETHFFDAESGRRVTPHGGSVYYNAYRHKWIAIFVEVGGKSSYLGEVWYAEADTPTGPWAYAHKVVTHDKYSFYNPKQHPYFDKDGGRVIFFEGTYSHTFSGSAETATPRYDYNQIMYRLNLADPRLVLPMPVYQVRNEQGKHDYLLCDDVEKADKWDSVESVPFYAIEPEKAPDQLMAIYVQKVPAGSGQTIRFTSERPNPTASALFCGLPLNDLLKDNSCVVSLYEYRHPKTGQYLYSTESQLQEEGWIRTDKALCRVWKTPAGPLLLDGKAKPVFTD